MRCFIPPVIKSRKKIQLLLLFEIVLFFKKKIILMEWNNVRGDDEEVGVNHVFT